MGVRAVEISDPAPHGENSDPEHHGIRNDRRATGGCMPNEKAKSGEFRRGIPSRSAIHPDNLRHRGVTQNWDRTLSLLHSSLFAAEPESLLVILGFNRRNPRRPP